MHSRGLGDPDSGAHTRRGSGEVPGLRNSRAVFFGPPDLRKASRGPGGPGLRYLCFGESQSRGRLGLSDLGPGGLGSSWRETRESAGN